jgi:hypothetical protein
MKNFIAALFLMLASMNLRAQPFAPDNELDTVPGGKFQTAFENEVYRVAILLPDTVNQSVIVTSRSPLTIKFWRPRPPGWDTLVFDTDNRTTNVEHRSFGLIWNLDKAERLAVLQEVQSLGSP